MREESRDTTLRRLHMRSIRRGIKEMDLILTRFAEQRLTTLSDDQLLMYDALLSENDQDLYLWISDQAEPPVLLESIIAEIRRTALNGP